VCPIKKTNSNTRQISYRNFSEANIQNLETALANLDWTPVVSLHDVNASYSEFLNIFSENYDHHIPLVTRKFNKYRHRTEPWITTGILTSLKKRDKMHSKMMKQRNPAAKQAAELEYKSFKNILNKIIKLSKKTYWNDLLAGHQNDVKTTWKCINQIMGKSKQKFNFPESLHLNNKTFSSPQAIATGFNDFYTNIGPDLARKLPPPNQSFTHYIKSANYANSFFMHPSSEDEIISVAKTMKPKASSGFDSISPKLLQGIIRGISFPLKHIINLSLEKGEFPNKMKIAKVIPIFKSGESSSLVNYRPISLLPTFSKVLERIVYRRLDQYLKKNKVLTASQYGFQASLSTEFAILELQDRIASALSSGSWCLGVFLDLSKAFDTINHNILIKKLESYGIRGLASSWFQSYFSNRKQYTLVKDNESSVNVISCGVPQGSILGPILFLIYMNDINNVINTGVPVLFADDTNILYTDKNLNTLKQNANYELKQLSQWFTSNKLSVNTSKTKVMLFYRQRMQYHPKEIQIKLNDTYLEMVPISNFSVFSSKKTIFARKFPKV
jgi:hypothetical protein